MDKIAFFDVISVALILFLGIKGILRGFLKEFFAFIGIIGGIYFGSHYALEAGKYLDSNFLNLQNKSSVFLIGFVVVFTLFWLGASIIGSFLDSLLNQKEIGVLSRIFGFFISSLKIFFIISVMIYILSNIKVLKERTQLYFENSKMYPIFLKYGSKIIKLQKPKKIEKKEILKIKDQNQTKVSKTSDNNQTKTK